MDTPFEGPPSDPLRPRFPHARCTPHHPSCQGLYFSPSFSLMGTREGADGEGKEDAQGAPARALRAVPGHGAERGLGGSRWLLLVLRPWDDI